jgi:hypothetical protein
MRFCRTRRVKRPLRGSTVTNAGRQRRTVMADQQPLWKDLRLRGADPPDSSQRCIMKVCGRLHGDASAAKSLAARRSMRKLISGHTGGQRRQAAAGAVVGRRRLRDLAKRFDDSRRIQASALRCSDRRSTRRHRTLGPEQEQHQVRPASVAPTSAPRQDAVWTRDEVQLWRYQAKRRSPTSPSDHEPVGRSYISDRPGSALEDFLAGADFPGLRCG